MAIIEQDGKMKIGIDVDGVLRDFCDGLTKVVLKHYPEYMKDDFVEIDNQKLENNFNCTKEDLQQIYWYDYAHTIMADGAPMYGAIKQMYDLFDWAEEKGHSLVCITSQKNHARHHTLAWLAKYGMNFDTVYFRKGWQKWQVDVDFLVDDSPSNFDNWVRGRGMQYGFILMDAPYNQHCKSDYRINELKQIKDII